jgi:small-conductance mechanosensitive channel
MSTSMIEWLSQNWMLFVVPVIVFLAFLIVGLWVRRSVFNFVSKRMPASLKDDNGLVLNIFRAPFVHWFLIIGAYVAIQISVLNPELKIITGKILASLFVVSIFWIIMNLVEKLLKIYVPQIKNFPQTKIVINNVARVSFIVICALIILELWGAPVTPLIIVIAVALLILILATRDATLNIFSGFELYRSSSIKLNDYIKLNSGEEGYIIEMGWRNTKIRSIDGAVVLIPNSRLLQSTVINYGRPLKKATSPFHFYTHLHLKQLTGQKAHTLNELISLLKNASESVIYYHTHHFFEEYQYLAPRLTNDFALWVQDSLSMEILSEKLANINTYDFTTVGALKDRIVAVLEEYVSLHPEDGDTRADNEFYLINVVSIISPTKYSANDLREFVEILRQLTVDSLFYHFFESRLRLKKGTNDFSTWFKDCLNDDDLAEQVSRLDPYNYTLEGLRSMIIQIIEKRIK